VPVCVPVCVSVCLCVLSNDVMLNFCSLCCRDCSVDAIRLLHHVLCCLKLWLTSLPDMHLYIYIVKAH
jgi:hypothetical protein